MPRRWMLGRNQELTTVAQDTSIMRTHVLPPWHNTSVAKIDYTSVQQWITENSQKRSAATVHERFRLLSSALRAAVHDRLISTTPCEGIRLPKRRRKDTDERTISRQRSAVSCHPSFRTVTVHSSHSQEAPACGGANASACAGTPSISTMRPRE